jgi:hypothetical protein
MTSRRSTSVGMATRACSTASDIARLKARAPASGHVHPGAPLSQETVGATGSVAALLTGPVGNVPRSLPIKGDKSSLNLPYPSFGGELSLRGCSNTKTEIGKRAPTKATRLYDRER